MTIEEMILYLESKVQEWQTMFEGYGNEETEQYNNYISEVSKLTEIINNLKGQLPQ